MLSKAELEEMEKSKEGTQKDWDEIIPEEERRKFEEEEREKAEKDLFLGPRQRNKVLLLELFFSVKRRKHQVLRDLIFFLKSFLFREWFLPTKGK